MRAIEALQLPEDVLADLYSNWSEDTWAASWISGGEPAFVRWLLNQPESGRELSHYELEGVARIRRLLYESMADE